MFGDSRVGGSRVGDSRVGRTVDAASTTIGSGRSAAPRRRRRTAAVALIGAVGLLAGVLSACTGNTPQAVLNVPGNYVADLWNPPPGYLSGSPGATVLMCLDEASAVHLETGDGGQGSVGVIRLEWAGTTYSPPSNGSPVTLTTPVLQPGCGTLYFAVDCCHVDNYLAIKATKV